MHSYSSVPGSAAAKGLSKSQRAAQGKKTGVIGQIHLASILAKGGDGNDVKEAFGGQLPPHIRPDVGIMGVFKRLKMLKSSSSPKPMFFDATTASRHCITTLQMTLRIRLPRLPWPKA
jgi:hypothetical protein